MSTSNRMRGPENLLEHAVWLRRLAYSLVRDDAAADELVQETWLAALRNPPGEERPHRPWLRRVITNVARFRWRSDRNRGAREHAVAALADAESLSPEQLLDRHETQQLLSRLVSELEEPFRETILLRYAEGLSPAAIARRLGIPAGTVRSRLHEALERLRVRLDALHRGDRRSWILALAPIARGPAPVPAVSLLALVCAIIALTALVIVWSVATKRTEDGARTDTKDRAPAAQGARATPSSTARSEDVPGWIAQSGASQRHVAGIVLAGGKPFAGAEVRLTSDLARTGLVPVLERRTGADGRFDFGLQPPREIELGAAAPGLLAAVEHIDLRDPTANPASDALELTLRPCVASLYGMVTDASGDPIASAELLREDVIGTRSDATGAYEVCMRPVANSREQLRLVVRAHGFGSMLIEVGLAGREHHDVVLTPEAVIDGRARTAEGTPVANARIWIERADSQTRRETEQTARLVAVTDSGGRFRFDGLAGGPHRVGGGGHAHTATPLVITVSSGSTRSIEVTMVPSAIVRGRVVRAGSGIGGARIGIAGADSDSARSQSDGTFVLDRVPPGTISFVVSPYRVRAPQSGVIAPGENPPVTIEVEPLGRVSGVVRWHGEPVPGARVCAGPNRGPNICAYADNTGTYLLEGLEPDNYVGFADDAATGAAAHDLRFTIVADGERRLFDVDLRAGARVAGVVVDRRGAPVGSARVELSATQPRDGSRCVSDASGRFECTSMRGGATYEVSVFAGPGQSVPFRFEQPPSAITLADGNSRLADVRLIVAPERAAIRGTVVDAAGAAVSDARVRASGREPGYFDVPPSTATDADGSFSIPGLTVGAYELEIRTADGFRVIRPGIVPGGDPIKVVVDPALCRTPPEDDPMRAAIVSTEPKAISTRPERPLIWDQRLQLIGWDIPARVSFGKSFEMTLYYRVLAPIDQPWKVFVHFDGSMRAGHADHEPLAGRCQMTTWQPGSYIVDRFNARIERSEAAPAGSYRVWTGFFVGFAPTWINMSVTDAPAAIRDDTYQRVNIATVVVE
jgi:RNA polymerase sigma-70 factor (ECF subfamily)